MSLPKWMSESENYHPRTGKGGLFTNKKILTNLLNKLHVESKVNQKHIFHPIIYLTNVILVIFIFSYSYNLFVI